MISYSPLWETLKEKGITLYQLNNTYKISNETISRFKKSKCVTTKTLDQLCEILNCNLEDIATYQKPPKRFREKEIKKN